MSRHGKLSSPHTHGAELHIRVCATVDIWGKSTRNTGRRTGQDRISHSGGQTVAQHSAQLDDVSEQRGRHYVAIPLRAMQRRAPHPFRRLVHRLRCTLYGVTGSFCTAVWQGERVRSEGPNCASREGVVGGTPVAQRFRRHVHTAQRKEIKLVPYHFRIPVYHTSPKIIKKGPNTSIIPVNVEHWCAITLHTGTWAHGDFVHNSAFTLCVTCTIPTSFPLICFACCESHAGIAIVGNVRFTIS